MKKAEFFDECKQSYLYATVVWLFTFWQPRVEHRDVMNQRRHFNNVILMIAMYAPPSSSVLSSPQLQQAVCGEQNKSRAEQMLLRWTCIPVNLHFVEQSATVFGHHRLLHDSCFNSIMPYPQPLI